MFNTRLIAVALALAYGLCVGHEAWIPHEGEDPCTQAATLHDADDGERCHTAADANDCDACSLSNSAQAQSATLSNSQIQPPTDAASIGPATAHCSIDRLTLAPKSSPPAHA